MGMKSEEIGFLPGGTGAVQVPYPVNLTQLLLQYVLLQYVLLQHAHDGLSGDVQS